MLPRVMMYLLLVAGVIASEAAAAQVVTSAYRVADGGIAVALTDVPGDAARGREIAASRQAGMCVLCHQVPSASDRFQGDIATNLAGAGARWTVPQLRLRMVDSRQINRESVMPAYYRTQDLTRVGATWRDKPILDAQQVEDVVAWLATLR